MLGALPAGAPAKGIVSVEGQTEALAAAPSPALPVAAPSVLAGAGRVLSNERTDTAWAHPELGGWIHARPSAHSRRIATIHLFTEDGFPEVYLLLREARGAGGEPWIEVRVPGRPNGRVGWLPREALGAIHRTRWAIFVDLRQQRLRAYFAGRLEMVAPIGVGKPSTPTPTGHFWIRERFSVSERSNPYWPYALGTSDYSTLSEWPGGGVIGIHGDYGQPQLIPGDPSHGCVRMRDSDLAWLAPRVTLGTPVDIVTGT
jgi:hypothetical protein